MVRGNGFLGSIFIGFILFLVSFFVLFINEYIYVNSLKIADFAEKNAIVTSSNNISPANENKLVHLTGQAYSQETLTDSIISIPNAIALFRDTEIYQWQEIETKKDDTSTPKYEYRKVWSKFLIDSSNFQNKYYSNPTEMKYKELDLYAQNVGFGNFYLSESIIKNIKSRSKILQLPYSSNFRVYNGFYFTGMNYDNPVIGDQKLAYSFIPSGVKLSVIAKQSGNRLESMNSKYGNFTIVSSGTKNLKDMLTEYRNDNSNKTWIFRGIGLLLMLIGLNMMIMPVANIGGMIPVLGQITKFAAVLSTFILTISLGTITIAAGWLFFRPEIAIPLIIIAIFTIISLRKKKKIIIPE